VDPTDADDLLQEIFMRIHAGLGGLEDEQRIAPWVFAIARNVVVDHRRARRNGRAIPDDLAAEPVERDTLQRDIGACLERFVGSLPEPFRDAVAMAELEGRSQAEIADALGLSLSGAKSRVQRGRERLKGMVLDCCHVEFDRRGTPVDWAPREDHCRDC
jgi:RNA polymerase sigma-70 factor (ECF subfamily)